MTPRRVGSVYVYDQPNKPAEDYDVPTSCYFVPGTKPPPIIPDDSMTYDIPVSSTGRTYDAPQVDDGGDTYDVPRNLLGNDFESAPWSNRSSALSDASGGSSTVSSSLSFHSLHVGSTPSSSERSSADMSTQDIYDIPPSAKIAVGTGGKVELLSRQLKSGGSFEKPDIPRKKDVFKVLRKQSGTPDFPPHSTDIYDVPSSKQFGYDSSDYDVPKVDCETDELDVEVIYDSVRSASKPGDLKTAPAIVDLPKKQKRTSRASSKGEDSVYDIPPQVMKDTTLVDQSRSEAFSELVNRFSHCSDDSESSICVPYDELPLELDTALELLVKLQQYVQRSTTKLLGFVSATWRQKDELESRLYDIKIASVAVKCCLQDFVEFGQGALANSARAADRKLIQKIVRQLEPLQASLQKLNNNMANLDAANWQLSTLVIEGNSANANDDLNEIVNISKDVPSTSRLMTSLIQGNSSLLFKCPQRDSTRDSTGKPPSGSATSQSKPRRPPPPLKPKPRLTVSNQRDSCDEDEGMQKRPLPSPPSTSASTTSMPPSQPNVSESVYAVPRSLQEEVTSPAVDDEDYENDSREWLDEYDYVQLTSAAATAQQKKMEERNANVIKASNKDKQLLNKQRNTQNQYSPSPVQQPPFLSPSSKSIVQSPQSANSPQSIPSTRLSNTPQRDMPQCQPPHMVPLSQLSGSTYSSTVGGVLSDMPSSPEHRLSTPFMIRLERLKQETQTPVQTLQVPQTAPPPVTLDENERQIVMFYASQIDDHLKQLIQAIGAFFQCVEYNQPPKVFISYSKFVVLAAHKLVYTGDSIARNIYTDDVQSKITSCANLLCDCLKETVTATKVAALHYPSIVRVQEMVDRVVDVSHAGNELRLAIIQAAML